MKSIWLSGAASALLLAACAQDVATSEDEATEATEHATDMVEETGDEVTEAASDAADDAAEAGEAVSDAMESVDSATALAAVLAHERRADDMARDVFRNPAETLAFFEVEPNHAVVEALPGGGWYGRILAPYVSGEGQYMAINYPMPVYEQLFGENLTDERRAGLEAWEDNLPAQVEGWGGVASGAYRFGGVPAEAEGTADRVLYIRALHNMARVGELETTVNDAYALLKPGGIVGVVQHRAPADEADDRATGSRGYLRQADVIAAFEAAGFVFEASSEVNANPNDAADYDNGVWMLPPTNGGDTEEQDIPPLQSTGESDRMTLKFRKPE